MSQVEDYVQFEATVNTYTWDNERILDRKVLQMVPCSAEKFHEPYKPKRDFFL